MPLKIKMPAEPEERVFPLDWPALRKWNLIYSKSNIRGFTGCSVVSQDLKTEYGSTGSAMVWEMFDSVAYDAKKFQAMLDQALKFAEEEKEIRSASSSPIEERIELAKFRSRVFKNRMQSSTIRRPPQGFTAEKARELFRMTGDLKDN